MKLSEKFKETLIYCFLLLILSFMLLACELPSHKSEDTKIKEWQLKQLENLKYVNDLTNRSNGKFIKIK